jgi:hypothetical protein
MSHDSRLPQSVRGYPKSGCSTPVCLPRPPLTQQQAQVPLQRQAPSRSFVCLEPLDAHLLGWAANWLQGGAVFYCVGQACRHTSWPAGQPKRAVISSMSSRARQGAEDWEMAVDVIMKGNGGVDMVEPGRGEAVDEGGQDLEGGGDLRGGCGWGLRGCGCAYSLARGRVYQQQQADENHPLCPLFCRSPTSTVLQVEFCTSLSLRVGTHRSRVPDGHF